MGKILSANRQSGILLLEMLFIYHRGALISADVLFGALLDLPLYSSTALILKFGLIEMVDRCGY